jgi:hypothetical protein
MGEVIRKGAAVDAVIADIRTTLNRAAARGGEWKALAEERLGPTEGLLTSVEEKLEAATEVLLPLALAIDAEDEDADRLLGGVSDDLWNALGRPGFDPHLSILFPGGIAYYAEGRNEEQPDRMDLLVELLGAGLHPKLDKALTGAAAKKVAAAAKSYRAKVDAARGPRARVELLTQVKAALARSGQVALSNLKRAYLSHGMTETEIHKVIPDRGKPKKEKPEGG